MQYRSKQYSKEIAEMISEVGIIVLLAVVRIDAQADCTNRPDGPCCAGCHSYTYCLMGVGTTVDCPLPEQAYNSYIGKCDLMGNTPPPCGNNNSCTALPDGKYPVMDPPEHKCEAFFTCLVGQNLGANPCNSENSTVLVFHPDLQVCDWRYNVPPPCGTYGVSPAPGF